MKNIYRLILISIITFPVFSYASLEAEIYTLRNGMTVALIPNNKSPVISHMVWYKIGAKDEPAGKSGVAHFLEHLMFKGTAKYGAGEFSKNVSRFGGNHNAFTSQDFTAYYQNISKDKLELVMDLESDRMENLLFDKEEINKERQVIIEERNTRTENNPRSLLREQMMASLFQNHPYGIPIIGWKHEIEDLKLEDLRKFYLDNYAPNNAILVISGDIDSESIKPLIAKYYESMMPADLEPYPNTKEPVHRSARKLTLNHPNVSTEQIFRYYLAPSQIYGKSEYGYALTMLSQLLGSSSTSLFYRELVEKQKIAVAASTRYNDLSHGPSVFSISATPAPGVSIDRLESEIEKIILQVIEEGFSEENIKRNKNLLIADTIYAQEDLKTLAFIYGQVLSLGLTKEYVTDWDNNINKVTNNDIKEAAKYVFDKNHSVTGYLRPPQKEGAAL